MKNRKSKKSKQQRDSELSRPPSRSDNGARPDRVNSTSTASQTTPHCGHLTLLEYFQSQMCLARKEDNDNQKGSSRFRVYNSLFRIPYHLERLIWVGVMSCLDASLTLIIMSPLRLIWNLVPRPRKVYNGSSLFDFVCCVVLVLGTYLHVKYLEPGMVYFGMKDVTAEFLKITLLYVALDISEKILSNIGVDVIEMFMESCYLFVERQTAFRSFLLDCALFFLVTTIHSVVILSIAMVWYVALESEKAILSFMIISNFGEIKTTVFKRFDSNKILSLCRLDIVERVNLVIVACFIGIEDLGQSGKWTFNKDLIFHCLLIVVLESLVDMIKHSVVVNFNNSPPGIYREYLRDLFQTMKETRGQEMTKKLIFEPLGSAMVILRILVSALCIGNPSTSYRLFGSCLLFVCLLIVKLFCGWSLQVIAVWYQNYYDRHYSGIGKQRVV